MPGFRLGGGGGGDSTPSFTNQWGYSGDRPFGGRNVYYNTDLSQGALGGDTYGGKSWLDYGVTNSINPQGIGYKNPYEYYAQNSNMLGQNYGGLNSQFQGYSKSWFPKYDFNTVGIRGPNGEDSRNIPGQGKGPAVGFGGLDNETYSKPEIPNTGGGGSNRDEPYKPWIDHPNIIDLNGNPNNPNTGGGGGYGNDPQGNTNNSSQFPGDKFTSGTALGSGGQNTPFGATQPLGAGRNIFSGGGRFGGGLPPVQPPAYRPFGGQPNAPQSGIGQFRKGWF